MNNIDIIDIVRRLFEGITTLVDSPSVLCWTGIGLIILGGVLVFLGKRGVLEPLLMIPMGLGMIVANAGNLYLDPTTAVESERASEARWINSENRSDVRYFTVVGDADFAEKTAQPDKYIRVEKKSDLVDFLKKGKLNIIDGATQNELRGNVVLQGDLNVEPLVQGETNLVALMQKDWIQPIYNYAFSNNLIACFIFMGIGVLLDVGFLMARPFQSMFVAFCAELGTIVTFPVAIACGLDYG